METDKKKLVVKSNDQMDPMKMKKMQTMQSMLDQRSEVDAAIASGSTTLRSLKVSTRLGMGPCQGRMCQPACARRLVDLGCNTVQEVGPPAFRTPLVPVTLGELSGSTESNNSSTPEPAGAS